MESGLPAPGRRNHLQPISGKCLDIINANPANATPIVISACHLGWNQAFGEVDTPYNTQWITVNADPNGDGAASTTVGPASVNLLTGDNTLSATDIDEFGLSVSRTSSSREPNDGWVPQGERLTANQQQISTDLTGIGSFMVTSSRVTTRGQGSSPESLRVVTDTGSATNDTFVYLGGDTGGMRLSMKAGLRYRASGWIYVPEATGLTSGNARGLGISAFYKTASGYTEVGSPKASWTGGWQELSVDFAIPADATEAFVRYYNGFTAGTNKEVFWDNLSVREVIAPFGPSWRGGASDAMTANEYLSLEFTSADL